MAKTFADAFDVTVQAVFINAHEFGQFGDRCRIGFEVLIFIDNLRNGYKQQLCFPQCHFLPALDQIIGGYNVEILIQLHWKLLVCHEKTPPQGIIAHYEQLVNAHRKH